jgi:hypothetical protein
MLVIVSLTSFGFGAPTMAGGGSPDCMAMMLSAQTAQSDHASIPDKMLIQASPARSLIFAPRRVFSSSLHLFLVCFRTIRLKWL